MSYFPKTEEAAHELIEAVLDDSIVRAIEDWQDSDADYSEHIPPAKMEAEKKRLAAFLAKRYEVSAGPDVMDSRLARALRSFASGVGLYYDGADLTSPAWVFTHMEQMNDLKYLLEDTEEEAEAQGWATEEMPAEFPALRAFLEYQHKLIHQWIYHLSVCENCFGGERSDPMFPPVDSEKVMDEAGQGSQGDRQQGYDDPFGGAAYGSEGIEPEEYKRLIQPSAMSVDRSIRIKANEIGPAPLQDADLNDVSEAVRHLLQQNHSPVHELLDEMDSEGVESFYIRLRFHPDDSPDDSGTLACFVSSGYDIRPEGLSRVSEEIGEDLADHIADHVKPKLQERAGLPTVIIEVETDERLTHVVLESDGSVV